ncbi:S-layer homology domain-containing protein [Alkaliphilus sp. MSJ-5]|uniref:S-layer homology domain-containing protein n=1 Tax=Alkaliphilus flagellatus TaxID=2841507 RepID=A0ABS6G5D0_9FIRM|nr:S-layer homology domain-containing protein [Alkaliphilus flagellatus]MBU5677583.1 S-layer homology domain-containing protein [Alkaliphilus flagellatus]
MKKTKVILIVLVMILIQSITTSIDVQAITLEDRAYNEGKAVGRSSGQIYGQKDYINGKRNNWQKAHAEEEKIVIDDYNLKQETATYRFNFLKGFREEFKLGYENGYKNFSGNVKKTTYEIGLEHGKIFGIIDGEIYGKKDYYEGKVNDWRNQIPSEASIRREHSLNNDADKYAEGFLLGYKIAFEESYTNTYRETNIDTSKAPKENGILHGTEMGFKLGSTLGQIDFADKKSNNWEKALPSNLDVMIKYNLNREVQEYREGFLVGFKDGFRDGYIESFQQQNINLGKENINYKSISMLGGNLTSTDGIMKLEIEPGTIYEEKYLSIQKGDFPILYNANSYIPVTNSYFIRIENQFKTIGLHNPIMLTFKYYGSERGGIYQLVDDKWRYLYSDIKDGEISTKLDSKFYMGGVYAVIIDDNYTELKDVHSNWAGQEVYTFIRRDYITGYSDKTFKPEASITRAEFITLLGRVMEWDNDVNHDQIKKFSDYNTFGYYGDVIAKATSLKLINGYADNTFKPTKPINYKEIEFILQRIPNNNKFKWSEIEDKMMYEKYTRSRSILSKENNITKVEVVYMLYHLQNEGKI